MVPDKVEYAVLSYAPGVANVDRIWLGSSIDEAIEQLTKMRARYPRSSVRFTVHSYYDPLEPAPTGPTTVDPEPALGRMMESREQP
jgi:hypothetical protein